MRSLSSLGRGAWIALAAGVLCLFGACSDEVPPYPDGPPTARTDLKPPWGPGSQTPGATSASAKVNPKAPTRVSLEDKAMGTLVSIATYTTDTLDEEAIRPKLRKALDEIRRLEGLMTTWREDSEVSRINAGAGKQAISVGPETWAVIEKSLWIGQKSDGVFDITFEAMKGLWKFDEGAEAKIPAKEAIDEARKRIDYRHIQVDAKAHTVKVDREGMRINLGGIAKGYAIDRAAAVLREEGITSFFAQAGGDLFVAGRKPDGSAWKVGVRDPRGKGPSDFFALLEVEDHAFSTAGDYERTFVKDGKRYHHIIDPRTGYPATASRSVTVWAEDAFTADAIDDAVFILGPEKGLALVESLPGCGAVVVDADNKVWVSKRLESKARILRQPTDGI